MIFVFVFMYCEEPFFVLVRIKNLNNFLYVFLLLLCYVHLNFYFILL